MYTLLLILHSWLRWGVIAAGFLAVGGSFSKDEQARDRWGLIFMISVDLQMLLGLLLYFVFSPITTAVFNNFGAAMQDPVARFWAVEHITTMVLAVISVHVGRVLARKAPTPAAKQGRMLTAFGLALILILIGTPWPGMPAGRPFFRV